MSVHRESGLGRRGVRAGLAGACLTVGVLVAGCTGSPDHSDSGAHDAASPAAVSLLPSPHVHGVAVDPGGGRVHLATHQGLFRYEDSGPQLIGPVIDLMGFTVAGPGHFYASGHPGPGADLPNPVGLLESVDGGVTWSPVSRQGISDFHALTASAAGILGHDGQLRASTDGTTWVDLTGPAPWTLAAAPGGATVLATDLGGVRRSTDNARTWAPVAAAPPLAVVTWADDDTAVGVSSTGEVYVSTDRGLSWQSRGVTAAPQAVAAAALQDGGLRVLVVTESAVLDSDDGGHTFTTLT